MYDEAGDALLDAEVPGLRLLLKVSAKGRPRLLIVRPPVNLEEDPYAGLPRVIALPRARE